MVKGETSGGKSPHVMRAGVGNLGVFTCLAGGRDALVSQKMIESSAFAVM
jgi:hypothetical protein